MGLKPATLKLLKASVLLWRKNPSVDNFGNDVPDTPETVAAVISEADSGFGAGTEGETIRSTPNETVVVYTDDVGIKVGDRIELPQVVGGSYPEFDGTIKRKVIKVTLYRDKTGLPLYQEVTTETD